MGMCVECKYWKSNNVGNPKWGRCTHPKCLTNFYMHTIMFKGEKVIYKARHTTDRYYNQKSCKTRFE